MDARHCLACICVAIVVCVILNGLTVHAAASSDVSNLITTLQQNYSRQVRPPDDQSTAVTISIGFLLNSIREFDEASERFSTIGVVVISWTDDRIVWSPANYGGLISMTVDNDLFWAPSVYVPNSLENFKRIGDSSYWKVKYFRTGLGLYFPGDVFTTHCQVEVEKYPWDTQSCTIMFGVIGYDDTEVVLAASTDAQTLQYYTGDGTWEMDSTSYETINNRVFVVFTMTRKPRFVILNVMIPVIFMFVLDVLVFLIPVESGERISFCLTVLLAIAVFLTLVADTMPQSATSISWFSYYLVGILAVCIFNTLAVIINLRLYFKEENDSVPSLIAKLLKRCKPNLNCCKNKHRITPVPEQVEITDHVSVLKNAMANVKGQTENNDSNTDGMQLQSTDESNIEATDTITWKDVSTCMDTLCFIISCVTFVVLTALYFNAVL